MEVAPVARGRPILDLALATTDVKANAETFLQAFHEVCVYVCDAGAFVGIVKGWDEMC